MKIENTLGRKGEGYVKEYLITKGYAIPAEDKHMGYKEVDIIAEREGCLHFVEVKTRTDEDVDPFEAIDARKRRRIIHFAEEYIRATDCRLQPVFDIAAVIMTPDGQVTDFEYIEDAFRPTLSRR